MTTINELLEKRHQAWMELEKVKNIASEMINESKKKYDITNRAVENYHDEVEN